MSSTGNKSAKKLLGILIGSATARAIISKNQDDIEQIIKNFLLDLQKNLRSAVDANLPVIYLVDSNIIVESMLDILNPANLIQLQGSEEESNKVLDIFQYFSSVTNLDTGEIFNNKTKLVTYENVLPTAWQAGGIKKVINRELLNAYNIAYDSLVSKKEQLKKGIILRINRDIKRKIKVQDINTIISEVGNNLLTSSSLTEPGSVLRNKFTSFGVSVVEDPASLITGFNPQYQCLITGQSFDAVTKRVHDLATVSLEGAIKNTGLVPIKESAEGVIGFKAGNFAAAGHAGIRSSTNVIGINTPQAIITSLILSLKNTTLNVDIFKDLAINTKHKDFLIDIDQNYASLGSESLGIGISWVRSQHTVTNSKELNKQEVKLVNNRLLTSLNKKYLELSRELSNALSKKFSEPTTQQFISNTFSMSPTLRDHIVSGLSSILSNTKYTGPKGTAKSQLPREKNTSVLKTKKVSGNKPVVTSKSKTTAPLKRRIVVKSTVDLSRLLIQLNGNLEEQIRKNMGTGSRRDVLNYRSGRFAQSAKVERLSESREGMITAFYTYMKNPYATFSKGGRQESPASRDPKTLISKSIRELAGPLVSNRMRAVLV